MFLKQKVRNKFILLRKKKYFSVNKSFFVPLIKLINKKKKKKLSLYYPSNYEENTLILFKQLKKNNKLQTSLPIVEKNGVMKFVKWKFSDPLKVNKYGFLEPLKKNTVMSPDILIVPLLAFDRFRNRLGYGMGYYDRFIRKQVRKNRKILTIGVAFSFQKYRKIPTSKYDVKLNYILTEKGIF
mgnify:CR=1 FL=1